MPFNDFIPPFFAFVVLCCNWRNEVTIHEIEGEYDPANLNLDKNDPEAWKIYAEKVRDIMSKMLDLPKIEFGYRQW